MVGGPDTRLLTDNTITNACRLVQPVVTEYQVVREKRSEASTVIVTDEIDQVNTTAESQQETKADDSSKACQVNETDKSKQDEQERAHQVRKDERAKMFDKAGVGTTTRQ
jgi:hypothetical protein